MRRGFIIRCVYLLLVIWLFVYWLLLLHVVWEGPQP